MDWLRGTVVDEEPRIEFWQEDAAGGSPWSLLL